MSDLNEEIRILENRIRETAYLSMDAKRYIGELMKIVEKLNNKVDNLIDYLAKETTDLPSK